MEFDQEERQILLQIAKDSIECGLKHNMPMNIHMDDYSQHLRDKRSCFVTLHKNSRLRGCVGSLVATLPLVVDVTMNAFKAAFQDPRFHPLTVNEFSHITLDISVLSQPEPLLVSSEADLLSKLRPGTDGLILSDRGHRATFLPSVWQQIPNPTDFVMHLKNKAGWPSDYWSDTIKAETYTAELLT